ncbi:hypothetical protein LGH82_14485 [Mesorhizobium sp. PAMC28654]|uniref:hypothetical protein n=1 Tax=Mesorhizobium sp. PAMC28654 TaxID=2880934 RepID=UPI001D09FDEF|nr:hypothetical protein [Mesorhizobium sp. PAMC28654]UDL92320.1 hypothetical protein LGH82_14485 [Mesorhizobium sp. PAMC28654]
MLLGETIRNLIENTPTYAGRGSEATAKVIAGGKLELTAGAGGRGLLVRASFPPAVQDQVRRKVR